MAANCSTGNLCSDSKSVFCCFLGRLWGCGDESEWWTEEWANNCWWGWQSRTHLGQGTHQCDETQRNNNTQALSTKIVFFKCKKIDNKRSSKRRSGQAKKSWCTKMLRMTKNSSFLLLLLLLYINSLSVLFFASPSSSSSSSFSSSSFFFFFVCLSSYTQRRIFLSKALVYYCFLVFRRTGGYISLDLFYFECGTACGTNENHQHSLVLTACSITNPTFRRR